MASYLAKEAGYPHCIFKEYPDDEGEGIAFLSKYSMQDIETNWQVNDEIENCTAVKANFEVEGLSGCIVNVHMDHKSIISRENQVVRIHNWILQEKADFRILCGDFNCDQHSSVYRFLVGRQSLHRKEAQWFDLAMTLHAAGKFNLRATLDFLKNPRWFGEAPIEIPLYCDWILMSPKDIKELSQYSVTDAEIFGERITQSNVAPSDHYGLYVDFAPMPAF